MKTKPVRTPHWLLLLLVLAAPATARQCNDAIPPTAPDERYRDNGDGTVTDLWTGLMWKRCVEGLSGAGCDIGSVATFTWGAALQRAEAVNASGGFAGYNDWRLPNIKELRSLVEHACWSPAINVTHFPNTPIWLWASSPAAVVSDGAWSVYFDYGGSYYDYRDHSNHVRLVRDGQ